jgi:rRNA-processing protein FCF1
MSSHCIFEMYLLKSRHLILVLIAFALLLIVLIELQASKTRHVSKFNSQPLRNALVKRLLEQDHIFVSANDPRLHVRLLGH